MGTHPIFESDFDCLNRFRYFKNHQPWAACTLRVFSPDTLVDSVISTRTLPLSKSRVELTARPQNSTLESESPTSTKPRSRPPLTEVTPTELESSGEKSVVPMVTPDHAVLNSRRTCRPRLWVTACASCFTLPTSKTLLSDCHIEFVI